MHGGEQQLKGAQPLTGDDPTSKGLTMRLAGVERKHATCMTVVIEEVFAKMDILMKSKPTMKELMQIIFGPPTTGVVIGELMGADVRRLGAALQSLDGSAMSPSTVEEELD